MRVNFIDLKAQYDEVKANVGARCMEIFETSAYVLGKNNTELEERIASRHGVKHAIAVNSGTDALRIMLQAGGIQPGDEVIVPAFTFVATAEVVAQLGAVPVFADIDPVTYNLDPEKVAAAVTPRTRAVMPVHLFGQLADMKALNEIAQKNNLLMFEDAAQVIYAHQNGVYTGNFGLAAGLSFYVTKNLGAAGDGGMILTNDDEVKRRSLSLRIHGMGRERYYYDEIGYTSRMAEVQAAFLCSKLDRLDDWTKRRQEVAAMYNDLLADSEAITPVTAPGNEHVWHQYTILHPRREALMKQLQEAQVGCAIFYPVPLHLHEPYRGYGSGEGSLPVTEKVSRECLSLPVHQHMTDEEVQFVAHTIKTLP